MTESRPTAPGGRILLIDDDRVFGLWATRVLEARGFTVQHVLDPMSGLRHIETEPWDLVITDVEMPRMSGLEFLERLRRLDPGLPVAVVTAHPTVDRVVTTMRQAATEFIQKPISPDDFAARVMRLASQRVPGNAAGPEAVLAIGAHPGDVEIGAAGTLLGHQAAGASVTVLTLADGTPADGTLADGTLADGTLADGAVTDGRLADGTGAGAVTGAAAGERTAPLIGTRLSLRDLDGGKGTLAAAIDRLIGRVQPSVLYTHSLHDDDPEHRDAHAAAVGVAWRVPRVYCFQSPSASIGFQPGHFVAIDEQFDRKLSAVRVFDGQPEVSGYLEADLLTSTARYWARYARAQHAEAFEVVRDRAPSPASGAGRVQPAP
jgi:CheY-like chemotaxis protein